MSILDKKIQFIKTANDNGITGVVTRQDIIDLGNKFGTQPFAGAKMPEWLMKNHSYRVGRGQYRLPTVEELKGIETYSEAEAEGEPNESVVVSTESSEVVGNID